jgi:hypothetical protein
MKLPIGRVYAVFSDRSPTVPAELLATPDVPPPPRTGTKPSATETLYCAAAAGIYGAALFENFGRDTAASHPHLHVRGYECALVLAREYGPQQVDVERSVFVRNRKRIEAAKVAPEVGRCG